MKKILIIGGDNGGGSAGDELMCEAACSFFRTTMDQISIITDAQNLNWKSPIPNIETIQQLRKDNYRNWIEKIIKLFLKLFRIFFLPVFYKRKKNIPLFLHGNEFLKQLQQSDIVFFSGCGGLTDKYPLNVLTWWSIILTAKKLNIPVFVSGVGIGPLRNIILQYFLKETLKIPEYISVRDKTQSLKLIKALGRKGKFDWGVDDSFFYNGKDSFSVSSITSLDIGLNVMSTNFQNEKKIEIFCNQVNIIFKDFKNVTIHLISITHEDYYILEKIQNKIINSVLVPKLNPSQTKNLISELDFLISSRYHGCVFGLSLSVPTIGLYSEEYWKNKNIGIFEMFEINDNVFLIDDFCMDNTKQIILEMIANKDLIALKLKSHVSKLTNKGLITHLQALNYIK